jgi:hypothetical protein
MTNKCFMPFKECTGFSLVQAKALSHELVDAKKQSKLGSYFARYEEAKTLKEGKEAAPWNHWDCETLKKKRHFFEQQLEIEEVGKRFKQMEGKVIRAKLRWFDEQIKAKCGAAAASAKDVEVMHFV